MEDFRNYRKKNLQPMRPYIVGEDLSGVSVSTEDTPEAGGMIAINPNNPLDSGMWQNRPSFQKSDFGAVGGAVILIIRGGNK